MTSISDDTPLRITHEDLESALKSDPQYDELLKIKNMHFENTDDLHHKALEILAFIKRNEMPWEAKDFIRVSSSSFVYLFQKFDAIYKQITHEEPQSLDKKEMIPKLFQCEQTTHLFVPWETQEVPNVLVNLLEVLYDDHENLDALLLLLCYKLSDSTSLTGPSHSKTLYFIAPFLKILHGEFDLFMLWKGDSNIRLNLVGKAVQEIKNLLNSYTDLSQEEILNCCQEIKEIKGDFEDKKKKLRILVNKLKGKFHKEEKYYETLGALSVIYHLWCLQEQDSTISIAFFKDRSRHLLIFIERMGL